MWSVGVGGEEEGGGLGKGVWWGKGSERKREGGGFDVQNGVWGIFNKSGNNGSG